MRETMKSMRILMGVFAVSAGLIWSSWAIPVARGSDELKRGAVPTKTDGAVKSSPAAPSPRQNQGIEDRSASYRNVVPTDITGGAPLYVQKQLESFTAQLQARSGAQGETAVARTAIPCSCDLECQEDPVDNPCTTDTCVASVCVRTNVAGGTRCDTDGIFCLPGHEECDGAGNCDPLPLASGCAAGQVCDEDDDRCRLQGGPCTCFSDCDDGNDCTIDTCNIGIGFCIHDFVAIGVKCGYNPTDPATGDTDFCTVVQECDGVGACGLVADPSPCEAGETCDETNDYCFHPTTDTGRCCPASNLCSGGQTRAQCNTAGGKWVSLPGISSAPGNNDQCPCPSYSSGVAPPGIWFGLTERVSHPDLCPTDANSIGDDYELNIGAATHFQLNRLIWIGGLGGNSPNQQGLTFEFYDSAQRLVDGFNVNTQAEGVRMWHYNLEDSYAPIVIPKNGSFEVRSHTYFETHVASVFTQTTPDVGINAVGTIWLDGPVATPGGKSGVLAFDMSGSAVPAPTGACCTTPGTNPTCVDGVVSWVCRAGTNPTDPADDGVYQGDGSTCAEPGCANGACCVSGSPSCVDDRTLAQCNALPGSFEGYGTTCIPNCCPSTSTAGSSLCSSAIPIDLAGLGAIGSPGNAITVTFSGDNTGAFANDCNLAGLGDDQFTWWEAFTVDDCSFVTLDYCCSSPPHAPTLCLLSSDCPCGNFIGTVADGRYEPPHNLGGERGDRCFDDNVTCSFGPLPAGTYYHMVLSDVPTQIHSYQRHFTSEYCLESACCYNDPSDPIACANNTPCTAAMGAGGTCIDGTDPDGLVDHCGCSTDANCITAYGAGSKCRAGECDPVSKCILANELDCAALDGYHRPAVNSCDLNPCQFGACCTGPGACNDNAPGGGTEDMTETVCEGSSASNKFVGGAICDPDTDPVNHKNEVRPCPICFLADTPSQCKVDDGSYILPSDRTNGSRIADNFQTSGGNLQEICWWPAYLDPFGTTEECSLEAGVGGAGQPPSNTEDYVVRFYEDNNGLPGAEVGPTGGQVPTIFAKEGVPGFRIWRYSGELPVPVTFTEGCYWIEITGRGGATGPLDSCQTYWTDSLRGDNYCVFDTDDMDALHGTDAGYGPEDILTGFPNPPGDDFTADMAFCLDIPLVGDADCFGATVGPPKGACCSCNLGCTDNVDIFTCLALDDAPAEPDNVADNVTFSPGKTCAQVGCPTASPSNDDCCIGVNPVVTNGTYPVDNRCATLDGPQSATPCALSSETAPSGLLPFGTDIWYQYFATCTGRLNVEVCDTGAWDVEVAVYGDGTSTCTCPTDNSLLAQGGCGDDPCQTYAPGPVRAEVNNGGCYMIRVAGGGLAAPGRPPGSPDGSTGLGLMNITCGAVSCNLPNAPIAESWDTCFGGGSCYPAKNKFLEFRGPPVPGGATGVAMRVKFTDMPGAEPDCPKIPDYSAFLNTTMWVGGEVCQGTNTPTGIRKLVDTPYYLDATRRCTGPGSTGQLCGAQTCTPTCPAGQACSVAASGWDEIVHVADCNITPCAEYTVDAISDTCLLTLPISYVGNLKLRTALRWADVVGPFVVVDNKYNPPSDSLAGPDFVDVGAMVGNFAGLLSAPPRPWCSVEENSPRIGVRIPITFAGVARVISAFQQANYPFAGPTAPNPCP